MYLKGFFIFDVVPLLSNFLYMVPGLTAQTWFLRLKLLRFARISYVRYLYSLATNYFSSHVLVGKLLEIIISTVIQLLIVVHVLTCIWIKLGVADF